MNLCCGPGWLGGTGVFWTDQRYKCLVGLEAKVDKGLQAARWEQGLHSDNHVLTTLPTFRGSSKRSLFSWVAESKLQGL